MLSPLYIVGVTEQYMAAIAARSGNGLLVAQEQAEAMQAVYNPQEVGGGGVNGWGSRCGPKAYSNILDQIATTLSRMLPRFCSKWF